MVAHAKYAQSNISASATYLLWLPLAYMHCLIVVLDGLICRGSSLLCNLHCDWLIASTKAAASGSPGTHRFGQDRNASHVCCCPALMFLLNQPFGLCKGSQMLCGCEQHQHRISQNRGPSGPVVSSCAFIPKHRNVKCSARRCVKWRRLVPDT